MKYKFLLLTIISVIVISCKEDEEAIFIGPTPEEAFYAQFCTYTEADIEGQLHTGTWARFVRTCSDVYFNDNTIIDTIAITHNTISTSNAPTPLLYTIDSTGLINIIDGREFRACFRGSNFLEFIDTDTGCENQFYKIE